MKVTLYEEQQPIETEDTLDLIAGTEKQKDVRHAYKRILPFEVSLYICHCFTIAKRYTWLPINIKTMETNCHYLQLIQIQENNNKLYHNKCRITNYINKYLFILQTNRKILDQTGNYEKIPVWMTAIYFNFTMCCHHLSTTKFA